MTIWRDWTGTNSVTGKPRPGATHSWWHYCLHCAKLTGPIAGPIGPRGWVADSDEGVPAVIADALRHQCKPERTKTQPKPQSKPKPASKAKRPSRYLLGGYWSDAMDDAVITRPIREAAQLLGLTPKAVGHRRKVLRDAGKMALQSREAWTPESDALILRLSNAEAARLTGRSQKAIRMRRYKLHKAERADAS